MNQLRSILTSSFLLLTLFFSVLHLSAEETIVSGWDIFDGTTITGSEFNFPSGAQSWAGFAAQDSTPSWKPFSFASEGSLTVTAAVPSGGTATLRFRFERLAYNANGGGAADTLPKANFSGNDYVDVVFTGSTEQEQTVTIPVQGTNTFSSFLMYIVERDVPVNVTEVKVIDDDVVPTSNYVPGQASTTVVNPTEWNTFNGTTNTDGLLEFPSAAASYAAFASIAPESTPFTFNGDGTVSFDASVPSGGNATVYFKFEANPWPNNSPYITTADVAVSGATTQTYTVAVPSSASYNYQTYNSFLLYIRERDVAVQIGDVTVTDDAYAIPEQPENGVRFVFQDVSAPRDSISLEMPWVEVNSTTPTQYSVSIPAYNGEYSANNPALTADVVFKNMLLYIAKRGQAVTVKDVEVVVGSNNYGGTGDNTLFFGNTFGGSDVNEDTNTYYTADTSSVESWAGFAVTGDPFGVDGTPMNQQVTVNFVAALSSENFADPPEYDGETAFGTDGTIDTSVDTAAGTTEDPLRWSAYVTWYNLNEDETKGSRVNGTDWGHLEDLPATWSDVGGESILTLKPNTQSFTAWSDPGATDGKYYLEQTLKIEGTYPNVEESLSSSLLGKTVNFAGTVNSYDLHAKYKVTAFIRCIDTAIVDADPIIAQDFAVLDATTGDFALSLDIPSGDTYLPSIGFLLEGRNANPDVPRGEIQIKDIVANFTDIGHVTDGNFTKTHLSSHTNYWSLASGTIAQFNNDGGVGAVKGQVGIYNAEGGTRGAAHIVSNSSAPENLSEFNMEAGSIYNLSFYMNRALGTDMGVAQFTFYDANGSVISSEPSDTSDIHAGSDNSWTQYSQTINVPNNATQATLKLYGGGSNSYIYFDEVALSFVSSGNTFSNWAANNGLTGADAAFNADPDNDGIPNGLENFLGTQPNSQSSGMSNIAYSTGNLSMQHSKNSNVSSDVSADYLWSTDLSTWNDSGATVNGTTVTITPQDDTPSAGTTTATAAVSGTDTDSVFIKVSVSNE